MGIVRTQTSRWLVAVFLEAGKLYAGWGQMAKPPGAEGSRRNLAPSLRLDHALLLHPEQSARQEDHLPAGTVGSRRQLCQGEALPDLVRSVAAARHVAERRAELAENVKAWFPLASSQQHRSGRDLGRQEPTPSATGRRRPPSRAENPAYPWR